MKSRDVDSVLPLARNLDEDPKSVPSFMASINGGFFRARLWHPGTYPIKLITRMCAQVRERESKREVRGRGESGDRNSVFLILYFAQLKQTP